jgi:hypothetical protein
LAAPHRRVGGNLEDQQPGEQTMGDPQDFEHQDPQYQQPEQQPEQPVDAATAAVEALSYADESAPQKLRHAITETIGQHEWARAVEAEQRRTTEAVDRFRRENPQLLDPDVSAAGENMLLRMQAEELDIAAWTKANGGTPPTGQQIIGWHRDHRVAGTPGITRDVTTLLETARTRLHEKFKIADPRHDPDRSRATFMAERALRNAALKGKGTPPGLGNETAADVSDSAEHVPTEISPEQDTLRALGVAQEAEAMNAQRTSTRDSAIQKMISARKSLAGRNPKLFLKGE